MQIDRSAAVHSFWIVSALYTSECHWLAWLYNHDSKLGRLRRYANAARAKAMVVHDRVLNGDTSQSGAQGEQA